MQQQGAQVVRVKATKGFYATVQGQFGIVNPGDVVDLDRYTASLVAGAGKAVLASSESPTRAQNYLPERKRNPRRSTEDLLGALVKATEANTQAIQALVAAQAKAVAEPPSKK